MEAYFLDWANLLLRWLHVITAIAWIGSSFYFVWLDNHLQAPESQALKAQGVTGELWAVHGGGFYNPQKYQVGPKQMPKGELHWFYWESYSTWLSGFGLFTVMYLWQAGTFLIDKTVLDWSPAMAGAAAIGFLVLGWLVYDGICRVLGRNRDGSIGGDARVGAALFVYVMFATWLACQLFAGRAAFLLIGAMLATSMSANVFFWIIPGQRKVVADLSAGRQPDPIHGQRGKQRSVHNTYFTLPVLIAMMSNHYGMLYQHRYNWLVLVLLMLLGAVVRQFFVVRHKGTSNWSLVAAALAIVAGLVVGLAPDLKSVAQAPRKIELAQVQAVVAQRCVMCHSASLANKGVQLDSAALIEQHALRIYQQTVVQKLMPLNNATQMTEVERDLIAQWFEGRNR